MPTTSTGMRHDPSKNCDVLLAEAQGSDGKVEIFRSLKERSLELLCCIENDRK
ncbi:predicted protein [Histoplasma mississippiense (nom. inval.)]|uniref:predicted protein n=1 Tax=Ajellomyces capsulatus (strain NAm1 / WU24) TaxID=2059318 RepID=UPI000157C83A|nr:predicted protein [Histoplasma mississippiense (nom. inval.)]EDN09182.1 predicted protein [Histoplasma mississippiense (nom. inval.)]